MQVQILREEKVQETMFEVKMGEIEKKRAWSLLEFEQLELPDVMP